MNKHLHLVSAEHMSALNQPIRDTQVRIYSSAKHIFTDFDQVQPLFIEQNAGALFAHELMIKTHVKMKIVVDESETFLGIITADGLSEQAIQGRVTKQSKRDDLLVRDFMQPRHALKAIEYTDLLKSNVADVLSILRHSQEQHCLVVQSDRASIKGLISASDIIRKLHLNLELNQNPSFNDIHVYLKHHADDLQLLSA